MHGQPASRSGGPIDSRANMWAGRFARRRRLEVRFASHSLSRFSFCALAFLSCASGRFQNSPYLRVSCSAARQRGGVNQWHQGRRLSATITVRARRWRPPHGVAQVRVRVRVQSPVAAPGVHWRQGSGFYGHAPCEEPQNPCESRRARRPAPPNATPAWIQCPPAGAPRAVRWQQYKAGTLPRAAHQIHAAVHTVLHRRHGGCPR